MKITDKKKPVNTIPQGVWEGSNPSKNKKETEFLSAATDLQENGYPINKRDK